MLEDFLAGKPVLQIAQQRGVSVQDVLDVVNAPEARHTMDAVREASRSQSAIYLEQHRAMILKRLVDLAVRTGELGIDTATPSGAFVIDTIRKACVELIRRADGRTSAPSAAREAPSIVRRSPRAARARFAMGVPPVPSPLRATPTDLAPPVPTPNRVAEPAETTNTESSPVPACISAGHGGTAKRLTESHVPNRYSADSKHRIEAACIGSSSIVEHEVADRPRSSRRSRPTVWLGERRPRPLRSGMLGGVALARPP